MRTITLSLREETAALIERQAQRRGLALEELLAETTERHLASILATRPKSWVSRERWDQLVRGEDCPICARLNADEEASQHGLTVCDLGICRLMFMRNQYVRGYCVLLCREHVKEPYELEPGKQAMFFDDMMRTGRALEQIYHPQKMNFEIQGNATPHLHCHVKPRYHGDGAPGIPIHQNGRTVRLTPGEYESQVSLLRGAIYRG